MEGRAARDVARAAGAGAVLAHRRAHRGLHVRMTPQAQVVVGAPDGDRLQLAGGRVLVHLGEGGRVAHHLLERAVGAVALLGRYALAEEVLVVEVRRR